MRIVFMSIFVSNIIFMTQPTNNNQITTLTDFVDSVFCELKSWQSEESPCYIDTPYCWKDTLIPIAVRLYELAQTDSEVNWWLLKRMSQVDLCKDGEEYFGKGDVFSLLLHFDSSFSRIILEKSVPQHVDELLSALKAEKLDAFMNFMPVGEENALIYNISRVLKRVEDVRKIYKDALSQTWGEPMGVLFLLIRRLFEFFAASYYDNHRPCDGMAYNFFLALCHTPYYGDRGFFSDLMNRLGELWIRGLRMTYLCEKDQMPPVVSQAFLEVFHGENAKEFEELRIKLEGQWNEELRAKLIKSEEGWLKIENYSFVCKRMSRGYSKPPYDWRGKPGNVRIYSERIPGSREKVPGRYRVVDRIILDNEPIPMEELKAVATSEDVPSKQGVPEQPSELKPLPIPGQIKLFKDDDCVGEFEAIPLSFDNKDAFLRELAVVLSENNFFSRDEQENFIHAFDGTTASSESHSKINWKKSEASLFALCYVLFDEEITGNWPLIADLFVAEGKSLGTSNASKYKKGTNRRTMQNHVKEALKKIGAVLV